MNSVTAVCLIGVLGADGQESEGNTVGAIPGQAGRDYPNFQVKYSINTFKGRQCAGTCKGRSIRACMYFQSDAVGLS